MLVTNQYNSNINRCNSLIENPYLFNKEEDKFDIIFINPPFGSKNNYKSLNKLFNNYKNKITPRPEFNGNSEIEFKDIYPIVSNTGTELFIQLVIYSLKKDGLACIILPDGELMTSNNMNIRKYILDNCQILKVITIQGGTFTNTGIKTKALIIKKCNNDNYNQEIEFIELNKEVKVLGIRKLNEKLQFNFEDIKEEIINYNEEIEIKTLGDVCEFQNGYAFKSSEYEKYNENNIGILQIKGIQNGYIDNNKITEYIKEDKKYKLYEIYNGDILIGLTGSFKIGIYNLEIKSYLNQRVAKINAKKGINQKYIYYWYICCNIEIYILEKLATGVAQANISTNDISNIKIPIPSLEIQNKIVEYLDMIYEEVIKTNNEKIENIKKLNKGYLDLNLQFSKDIEIKTLGEISIINPENMKLGQYTEINYIDISSVKGGEILELQKLTNDFPSRAKRIIKKGDILYSSVRPNLKGYVYISNDIHNGIASTGFANIRVKDTNIILSKYLYYIMTCDYINNNLISKAKGAQYPAVSFDDFENLKIPIPSIEVQNKIVEYLEFNDNLIKTLEKENEINKNNAELLMKQILYK